MNDWKITAVTTSESPLGRIVVEVCYACQGCGGVIAGRTSLPAPDFSEFVPYDQLTQELLLSWLWAAQPEGWRQRVEEASNQQENSLLVVPFPSRN